MLILFSLSRSPLQQWYSITYMYWSIIGTFITVFVGTLVSYCTSSDDDTYEAKLLHPMIVRCLGFMPGQPREFKEAPPAEDATATTRTSIIPDGVVLEVQDKLANGHDNFAYEKERTLGTVAEEDDKASQRIHNMTLKKDQEDGLEMKEHQQGESRKDDERIHEVFYSPGTTGVYKKYQLDC